MPWQIHTWGKKEDIFLENVSTLSGLVMCTTLLMLCDKLLQTQKLKTTHIYDVTISMGQKSGNGFSGSSAWNLIRVKWRCLESMSFSSEPQGPLLNSPVFRRNHLLIYNWCFCFFLLDITVNRSYRPPVLLCHMAPISSSQPGYCFP